MQPRGSLLHLPQRKTKASINTINTETAKEKAEKTKEEEGETEEAREEKEAKGTKAQTLIWIHIFIYSDLVSLVTRSLNVVGGDCMYLIFFELM